jgi:hypothetical protein
MVFHKVGGIVETARITEGSLGHFVACDFFARARKALLCSFVAGVGMFDFLLYTADGGCASGSLAGL